MAEAIANHTADETEFTNNRALGNIHVALMTMTNDVVCYLFQLQLKEFPELMPCEHFHRLNQFIVHAVSVVFAKLHFVLKV